MLLLQKTKTCRTETEETKWKEIEIAKVFGISRELHNKI